MLLETLTVVFFFSEFPSAHEQAFRSTVGEQMRRGYKAGKGADFNYIFIAMTFPKIGF